MPSTGVGSWSWAGPDWLHSPCAPASRQCCRPGAPFGAAETEKHASLRAHLGGGRVQGWWAPGAAVSTSSPQKGVPPSEGVC